MSAKSIVDLYCEKYEKCIKRNVLPLQYDFLNQNHCFSDYQQKESKIKEQKTRCKKELYENFKKAVNSYFG